MIKVYIKTDTENRITAVNSSAFLADVTDWIFIDEGEGDRYTHAQGNYFDKPIVTEGGALRYKYLGGRKYAERTAEEIAADEAELVENTEESTETLLLEMAADHEYRLCLMELGVSENDL